METPDINEIREQKLVEQKNIMQKAAAFASSVASRGVTNKKAEKVVKELRQLSCHGNDTINPCSSRKPSEKYPGSFFCGACGCGDKQGTQLADLTINNQPNYGKLDYPKVWCPLNMPGFQPYKPSDEEPEDMRNSRKIAIENLKGVEYIKEHSQHGEPTK